MTKIEKSGRSVKQHTVYKNNIGKRIIGVTTALGVLNKPALMYWANNIGLQGIKVREYVDDLAQIGTLAHDMALCYTKKAIVDTSQYTKIQIDLAETCYLKFLDYYTHYKPEVIFAERQLVSEKYQFGGTLDNYCMIDGKRTLLDYKTGKAIYLEHFFQLAAYKLLLEENGYPVDVCTILRIGRNDAEGFEIKPMQDLTLHTEIFLHCVELYRLLKEVNKTYV